MRALESKQRSASPIGNSDVLALILELLLNFADVDHVSHVATSVNDDVEEVASVGDDGIINNTTSSGLVSKEDESTSSIGDERQTARKGGEVLGVNNSEVLDELVSVVSGNPAVVSVYEDKPYLLELTHVRDIKQTSSSSGVQMGLHNTLGVLRYKLVVFFIIRPTCTGISQPPKGTIFPPNSTWRSYNAVRLFYMRQWRHRRKLTVVEHKHLLKVERA